MGLPWFSIQNLKLTDDSTFTLILHTFFFLLSKFLIYIVYSSLTPIFMCNVDFF